MASLYLLSVFVHVVAACVWVGSMVFFAAVVLPVARRAEHAAAFPDLIRSVGGRFRRLGWAALGTLIVTGTTNLALRGIQVETLGSAAFWRTGFGHALGCKLALVALVTAATATHDALASRHRRASAWLGRLTLVLSLAVLACAVVLVRGWPL